MKQFYFFISILFTSLSFSQNFTDTKGELQISASGTATYSLPIAVPPSIKGVAPVINLNYSSGIRGGIAGQGWNINSISTISRIATRRDIDGFVDGVDFDADDKLALDGQRLLVKTGTYWASGSTYETEYKSNTRIELKIEGTTTYFIVTAPDGSRSWYGSKGSGSLQNFVSLNAWYIVRFEDVNGNFIDYNYKTVTYNSINQLYIDTIVFSGNTTAGIAAQNKIKFNYRDSKRIERDYLKGVPVYATQILDNIMVYANNSVFRTYKISHIEDTILGYERVESIKEINAQNEESNPIFFTYAPIRNGEERIERGYTNNLAFDKTELAGDFDGDGRLDFVANNQLFTNLFNGSSGNAPIGLPTELSAGFKYVVTTLTANRLNTFQSIVHQSRVSASSNTDKTFKVYNLINGAVQLGYAKSFITNTVPLLLSQGIPVNLDTDIDLGHRDESYVPTIENINLEGDFNGDGISEIFIIIPKIKYRNEKIVYWFPDGTKAGSLIHTVITGNGEDMYVGDLNPNSSTIMGDKGFVKLPPNATYKLTNSKNYVMDFNGDGKSDILSVIGTGYTIYSFKQLAVAPWIELETIGTGTLDKFSATKQILFGDYNGDGKTDIMLPDSEGAEGAVQWHIYYSNANPAGGEFFTKESHNIVEYRPDTSKSADYKTQVHFSNYYAMDINGDGKSDLVRVWRKYYKDDWSINNHDTQWQVTGFINNIGKVGVAGFTYGYNSGVFTSNSPDIPIPVPSNYKYDGANTDLVLIRGHYNKIEYYQFNKNVDAENRLISVTESNGNVKQTIEYKPMEAIGGGLGTAATDFYSSSGTATYPNIEIIRNSGSYLVSKLTATINGVSKYQDFRYRGFVSNFDYGTVGFTRTTRSSWYLSASDTKIWKTLYNDVALRGANTITWSSTNSSTVFDAVPTNLLSTKTNVFSTYINPTSKVYNVLLDSQTNVDALSGVKSESTYTYDGLVNATLYYGLETKSVVKQYTGASLQGSVTTDSQYDNDPTGVGSAYYIGRPKKVNTSANNVGSGDTRTTEEVYTYTGSNLTKTEKKGHNTYAIIEDMTYDLLGNLLTKTVSAPAAVPAPTAPTARIIKDEYDTTKRFVVKKTDHQGFITTYAYNTLGQVTKSTNYMGVINDFTYDNWGKLINSTVTNASTVPLTTTIVYAKLATGGYVTTSTNNLEAKTVVEYDVLGRVVKNSTKGFTTNSMISKQVVYDGLGRKQKESEPYLSAPNLWTSYEYDYLVRPTKITAPTGKIQTLSYSVLTTTSNDDGKITTATVDALGNKVQSTDPGGTINFKYYADGQLKESDYLGNKVAITIDGWGNKIAMSDPSAGSYSYSYDAFGQLKTETTPNGTTSFVYDAAGKPTEKTIVGPVTNSKTTYAYNTLSQVTSSTYVDNVETKTTTNIYEYDALKKLFKTTETTPYAVFVKQLTYDSLGRVDKETSTATAAGKTSSKTIKNTYQNGFPWQILDDATQTVLWQSNTLNERGQLLTATLGNGIAITNAYDQYGYVTQIKHDKTSPAVVNIMTLNTAFEIKRGNLNSRTNSLFSRNEIFKYDGLDRLTEYTNGLGIQETQAYDDKGRITQNTVGTYEYDTTKTYQNKAITPTPEASGYYGNREGIFNDSMEDRTSWGTEKYPNTAFYSYDNTTAAHSGKNSLKLANTLSTEQYVFSDKWVDINNTVATEYTYSAWFYSDNPQAQVFLYMKDAANTITQANVVSNTKGVWTQIVSTFLVPANVKKLRLRLDNNGLGNIWFDDVQIRKTSDPATTARALNITYNTFKSPIQIEETGIDKISFTYNDGNDRSSMFYGGLQTDKLLRTYRKHYSADGSMEVKHNTVTGAVEFVTYIGGDGYSAPIVLKSDGTTQNYLYLHRDYQGTITAISDQTGTVVEKRLFDAWGNIVKVQDGAGNILAGLTVLDRGYTGHEHLQSIGIIHMNGRLYDPKLHRFLQPDNYIQEPYNTQNYHKYAYVLNNPLKYTDPSGEEIVLGVAVAIGAAIAALTYTITALVADVPFSVGGLVKSTFIGAASSAVTFGIGSAAGSLFTNFYSQAAFQAAAHGTFQGTMTAISGGKFWSGFAAGALSSIAASTWSGGSSAPETHSFGGASFKETFNHQGISGFLGANNGIGMIAFGTVSGGAGAALTGGNFWQGAVTGLVVSGLNHFVHEIQGENPNRTMAKNIVAKYKHGNIDEVEQWLDEHPFINKNGIVSFEGISGVSVNINKSNGNPNYLNDAFDSAAKKGITTLLTTCIKGLIGGGGLLLSDGGLAKVPVRPFRSDLLTLSESNARNALIDYVFRPQGPQQTPAFINGYNPYSGPSRFDTYYKAK
ncbi:RHS repeat-associated core domain-containing protein [Flavobacterium sp. N502536]|uniref:RHS repeat-associated core domain-containing protein n=1 Tax=Flavobacterium sp. N502536 TaxID=2986837 RepID=UPI00222232CC|nr:RHS repeat-associated core domain-containing protein [Flavobacterium sp. N502536]